MLGGGEGAKNIWAHLNHFGGSLANKGNSSKCKKVNACKINKANQFTNTQISARLGSQGARLPVSWADVGEGGGGQTEKKRGKEEEEEEATVGAGSGPSSSQHDRAEALPRERERERRKREERKGRSKTNSFFHRCEEVNKRAHDLN